MKDIVRQLAKKDQDGKIKLCSLCWMLLVRIMFL